MHVGKNVEYTVEGNVLTICVDLTAEQGWGKSIIIASTNGNVEVVGSDAVFGLNVYKKVRNG